MREEYDFSKGHKNPFAPKKQTAIEKDTPSMESQKHRPNRPATEVHKS